MKSASRAVIHNIYAPLVGSPSSENAYIPRYYLGLNHLLILENRNGETIARRFYFDDITALQCKKTKKSVFVSLVFFGLFLAFLLAIQSSVAESGGNTLYLWALALPIMAAIVISLLVTNPYCKTWLHTPNHREELTRLNRYGKARKALAEINRRIHEHHEKGDDRVSPDLPFHFKAPAEIPKLTPVVPYRANRARVMLACFGCTLIAAVLELTDTLLGIESLAMIGICAYGLSALLAALSIIQSYDTSCPSRARQMAGVILGAAVLLVPLSALTMAAAMIIYESNNSNTPPGDFSDNPIGFGFSIIFGAVYMGAAIVGFFALLGARKEVA